MNELALFAGGGGGILGGKLLGWRTVCAVEINAYCARRLMQRQNEGHLPPFPIWDDVCTFDGRPWSGVVDVVSGGFPCQDISAAGTGAGLDGKRSGLWVEMARIISEVRPTFCFVENSPMLTLRGLGRVLGDLAEMGYDAEWGVLGAADVGAPHQRDRIWIVAYAAGLDWNTWRPESAGQQREAGFADGGEIMADADSLRELQPQGSEQEQRGRIGDSGCQMADSYEIGRGRRSGLLRQSRGAESANGCYEMAGADRERLEKLNAATFASEARQYTGGVAAIGGESWWTVEPDVGRVAHGVAARVDRLQALGNGQVPRCHAEAWSRLLARIRF